MKKLLFAVSLFSLFFVTSCKNFLNGNDFLSGLEEAILYNNEPFISVTIQSDVLGTETITPANNTYKNEYKNKSSIKLNVQEKSDYQFTQWEVTPVGAVTFESSTERNTKAEINTQESEIKITPAIFERPSVVSFSPSNLVIQPKNSSICIDFNKKIDFSEEEINTNLSDFKIYMGGLDIHSYFDKPQILENADGNTRIIFTALREKMLPLSSTEATITVTVPENLFYVSENEYKIYSNKPYTYSYIINNQTLDYVDIIFKDVENQASLSIKENKKYYLDEEFSVICQAIPGYHIKGWKIVTNYGTETEAEVEPNILITDISDLTTLKVKVLSGSKNTITITPCMEVSKKLDATFTGKNGKVNILESKTYYPKDSFLLTFSENSEYYFTNWSIWDKTAQKYLTEDEIKAIFDFDINSYDQHITVKELEQDYNLELIAETVIRPKIISKSPEISPQGAYRDSTIQIMFNHSINSDSIYFTDEEIKKIIEKNKNVKTETTTIKDTENNDVEKYYCYYINEGTPEEQKFYKNIEITNYKTGENLNSCFDVPYFESSNVLLIPVVSDENSKPNPGTKILVSISQEVYYSDSSISRSKQNPIKMANIESWIYEVNDKVDDKNPIFRDIVINCPSNNVNSFKDTSDDKSVLTEKQDKIDNFLYQEDENNKNLSFNLSISLNDTESGPSSIQATLHNLKNDCSYTFDLETIINNTEIFYGQYDYSNPKNPVLKTELLTLKLPVNFVIEGENTIIFVGKDKKGNKIESDYYHFYYTKHFPEIYSDPLFSKVDNKIKIRFNPTTNRENLYKMVTKYRFIGISNDYQTIDTVWTDGENIAYIDLPSSNNYTALEIEIYPVSIFNTNGISKTYTLKEAPKINKSDLTLTSTSNSISVQWNSPTSDYDYIELGYYKSPVHQGDKDTVIKLDKNQTSYLIENLNSGTNYCIYIGFMLENNYLHSYQDKSIWTKTEN